MTSLWNENADITAVGSTRHPLWATRPTISAIVWSGESSSRLGSRIPKSLSSFTANAGFTTVSSSAASSR